MDQAQFCLCQPLSFYSSSCGLFAHGTGCVSAFDFNVLVVAYLRTALAACQPLILMFGRCVFAHGTGCVSAFDFNVWSLRICARHWLRVSL